MDTSQVGPASKPMLIIDPDIELLLEIKQQAKVRGEDPILLSRSDQAIDAIDRLQDRLMGVLVNPKLEDGKVIPVIVRRVLRVSPQTPIFYFCDPKEHHFDDETLKAMMIRQIIQRTSNLSDIAKAVQIATENFDPKEALSAASQFHDLLDTEVKVTDDQFSPIIAANFVSGSLVHFDLYVRLKQDHFVKILQSGDTFAKERLDKYLKKGVEFFYIRKAAQESYLKFCETLASGILMNAKVSTDVKIGFTLNQGEETIRFLKNCGLGTNALKHAQLFVANVRQMLTTAKLDDNPVISNFLKNIAHQDHGVTTTIISSLMLKPLSFSVDKSVKIVGLASLMHDIAIKDEKLLDIADANELAGEQKELFLNHPIEGAKLVAEIPDIESVIVQAIEQHHERRTRTGFPRQLGMGDICTVGEIVGLADEFGRVMKVCLKPDSPIANPILHMESKVLAGFSNPVAEAFRQAFKGR